MKISRFGLLNLMVIFPAAYVVAVLAEAGFSAQKIALILVITFAIWFATIWVTWTLIKTKRKQ